MSVRASERELSKIEYLKTVRDVEIFFVQKQSEKPKKFRYFMSEHLIKHAANAYSSAKIANSVYVDDVETKKYRLHCLKNAIYELQATVGQLDVLYGIYKSDVFTNNEIENISELIYNAINLINGVIRSDKTRYKDIA